MEVNLGDLREKPGYKRPAKWVLVEVAKGLGSGKLGYFP